MCIYTRTKREPWFGVTELETGIFLIILHIKLLFRTMVFIVWVHIGIDKITDITEYLLYSEN